LLWLWPVATGLEAMSLELLFISLVRSSA